MRTDENYLPPLNGVHISVTERLLLFCQVQLLPRRSSLLFHYVPLSVVYRSHLVSPSPSIIASLSLSNSTHLT